MRQRTRLLYMHTASLGKPDGFILAQFTLMWWRVLRSVYLAVPTDALCIFSYKYLSETVKSNWSVKRMGQSARWADLTIRLIVKANSMSARIFKCDLFLHLIIVAPERRLSRSTAKHHRLMTIPDFSWFIYLFTKKWRNYQGLYFLTSPVVFKNPCEPCIKV